MKDYNLLLLSSSNHVQLIESFKDAYKQLNLGGNIYTADINKYCASSLVSEKHFFIPPSDSDEYFPALEKIIKEDNINIVLSVRDEELLTLSRNKKFFDKLECVLLVSDEKAIALCRDKFKLSNFFLKNDIPHPKTILFDDLMDNVEIKYPILCKPRGGKAGYGIFKVSNYDSIEKLLDDKEKYIFQEYIEGEEYTIDLLSDSDCNVLSIIPRKRVLIKGGESIISITVKNTRIMDYTKRISELIGFNYHINIQCILRDNIPYFIEINPRFGGASNLSIKAGMNSPLKILQMIRGDKITPFIGEFKENLIMLRYTQDYFVELDS